MRNRKNRVSMAYLVALFSMVSWFYGVDYLLILITVQSILGNVESIGQKGV